jgi:hypothetical protein
VLKKKLHEIETANLLGEKTISSDVKVPILHWNTVLLGLYEDECQRIFLLFVAETPPPYTLHIYIDGHEMEVQTTSFEKSKDDDDAW